MAKIAITGAFGFIGRALTDALAQTHDVVALSRSEQTRVTATCVLVDYADLAQMAAALSDVDIVLHLADDANRNKGNAQLRPDTAQVLADAMTQAGVCKLVYASSIYARKYLDGAVSDYGAHKAASEQVFWDATELQMIALRLPPVYGPGGGGGFARLAGLVDKAAPLPVGFATAPRCYISRRNVVDLMSHLVTLSDEDWATAAGQAFEPSDPQPISTRDLAKALATAMRKKARILPAPVSMLRLLGSVTGKASLIESIVDPLIVRPHPSVSDILGWQPMEQIPESLVFLEDA
ncbi:UDP-glucose 4-epimerase [Sulfitobacter geojensis]|nr:UDP-glucose 4-epimerase [Sulfitobacter geojensis]